MVDPLITVLLPMYNGGRYLEYSLESVLTQTCKDFEFLIVNDCSTDDSLERIKAFNDRRIVVSNNAKNLGQTRSLNVGLRLAKGKYIARMDADDIAFPSWLEQQLVFIGQNPEYVVVSPKVAAIDSSNRITRILNSPSSENIILKSLIASPINHVGSLFCKDVILKQGGYDESFKIAADYDLWSRLLRKGHRIARTNKVLVAIRFHEQSLSLVEKGKTDRLEMSRIMRDNINCFTFVNLSEIDAELIWRLFYDGAHLSNDEFIKADMLLKNTYGDIRLDSQIGASLIDRAQKTVRRTIYMKKIFAGIKAGDIKEIRLTAWNYIRRHNALSLFSIIWVLSFLGLRILYYLHMAYKKFIEKLTRLRLAGALNERFQ